MKRVFWIGVGVAATVVVLRQVSKVNDKVTEVAYSVSPAGIANSIASLGRTVREAGAQLRESMAANEAALTAALLPSEEEQTRAARVRRERAARDNGARDPGESAWDDGEDAFF